MRGMESIRNHPIRSGASAVVLLGATAFGVNERLAANGEEEPRLEIPANTVEEVCDTDSLSPEAYLEAIGLGPYRTNEAYDEQANDRQAVITETINDIKGNTMGIALLSEALKQQSSDYTVEQFLSRVTDTYEELEASDERRQEVCAVVVENLETGTLESIKAPNLLEVTNSYRDGVLIGVQGTEVSSQAEHPVVTVKDENGAVRFGIALQEDRDGKFLLILNNGDATGDAGENVDDGTTGEEQQEGVAGMTTTTIAEIGGGVSQQQNRDQEGQQGGGGGTSNEPSDQSGPTHDQEGPGEGQGPGVSIPGEGEDEGNGGGGEQPTPSTTTTTQPAPTTTTTRPPQTTTTTTPPPTTTTTTTPPPSTTTTTQPKGEEPGPDCDNNPFDPRC